MTPRVLGSGDRVLLIAPQFFGYDREIAMEIERRGATVDLIADRPFRSPAMQALAKVYPRVASTLADRVYERFLETRGPTGYDHVLVVNGQTISREMLRRFRAAFPAARFVLWAWDSVENRPHLLQIADAFDHCATFDPEDADRYGFAFRPSFFTPAFDQPVSMSADIDVSFVGTAHTDRYAVVRRVRDRLGPDVEGFWYLYLQAPWVYDVYRMTNPAFRGARRSDFRFSPLSRTQIRDAFLRARTILEVEHPRQRGLTMRTFETVAAERKLITTNERVRDYSFFEPANICIIDRRDPVVSVDFVRSPYVPVHRARYADYGIAAWLDALLPA